MGKQCNAMEVRVVGFVLVALIAVQLVAAEVVTPAFVWSDLRCFGKEDRSVKYKSQTPESLVSNIFQDLRRCTSTQGIDGEEAAPEMIVAFIGEELQSEDISRGQPSGVLKTLQGSVADARYSMAIPYVTVASGSLSVAESLLRNVPSELGTTVAIDEVAVSGSCSIGEHDVKRLTGVPAVQEWIVGRKLPRADKKTDLLVICYSPLLDWSVADKSLSEGEVLEKVLSSLKSSGTSNVVLYSSDPKASNEKHHGILERHLFESTGNATTDCDALCRSRAVILEGIFVAFTLITILVSGICCMKAVKSPARFEAQKEQ
ncbi:uncharacterized protein [Physcomitrium patens]|uniref:V-type proton ATPase subunit S1/VOA1 transmembrane domain-containing protein n=2 Tax=Physcomitrium patens TaxID=3218 RepID=A0A2K1JH67_PHYPA|nr:uncharacterized protein LOC112291915 [Physcomitrium patens]PNR40859.1 hypothetical protein PHYPA_018262 [Physcomitrium patens]|eukprot:XP_024395670.1 uncharacterized protein LOC112291915 [Physcomitrella patens]